MLGAVAYNTITHETIDITDKVIWESSYIAYPVEGAGWKLMAFLCVKGGAPGMDYLSEAAVPHFYENEGKVSIIILRNGAYYVIIT